MSCLAPCRRWTSGFVADCELSNSSSGNVGRPSTESCAPEEYPSAQHARRLLMHDATGGWPLIVGSTPLSPTSSSTNSECPDLLRNLNHPDRRIRTRTSGGVGGAGGQPRRPYPDRLTNVERESAKHESETDVLELERLTVDALRGRRDPAGDPARLMDR